MTKTSVSSKCSKPAGEYCRLHNPHPKTVADSPEAIENYVLDKFERKESFRKSLFRNVNPQLLFNSKIDINAFIDDAADNYNAQDVHDLSPEQYAQLWDKYEFPQQYEDPNIIHVDEDDEVEIDSVDDAIDSIYVNNTDGRYAVTGSIHGLDFIEGTKNYLNQDNWTDDETSEWLNKNYRAIEDNLRKKYGAELNSGSDTWDYQNVDFESFIDEDVVTSDKAHEALRERSKIIDAHNDLNGAYQSTNFWDILNIKEKDE